MELSKRVTVKYSLVCKGSSTHLLALGPTSPGCFSHAPSWTQGWPEMWRTPRDASKGRVLKEETLITQLTSFLYLTLTKVMAKSSNLHAQLVCGRQVLFKLLQLLHNSACWREKHEMKYVQPFLTEVVDSERMLEPWMTCSRVNLGTVP